jgi:hypothetical protein
MPYRLQGPCFTNPVIDNQDKLKYRWQEPPAGYSAMPRRVSSPQLLQSQQVLIRLLIDYLVMVGPPRINMFH